MSRCAEIFPDDNPPSGVQASGTGVAWSESPLTPALSPLEKGGEGAGVGGFKISRLPHQVNSIDAPLSDLKEGVRRLDLQ